MQVNIFGFDIPVIYVTTAVYSSVYLAIISCSLIGILWVGSSNEHLLLEEIDDM